MTLERLQKVLSRAGLASRRAAEEWIKAGRVEVAGRVVTELGLKVDPDRDVVKVDGRPLKTAPPLTVVLYKPYGYVSTAKDPEGRRKVTDLVEGLKMRLYPVGRLDYDATGLLLLTNEGELAHRLMHPRYQVPRTYRVTVAGAVTRETLARLAAGLEVDGRAVPTEVLVVKRPGEKTVIELTVWEGRWHLIKRLMAKVRHPVLKLKRVAFGPLRLGGLSRGTYRVLTPREMKELKAAVGLL